MIRDIVCFVPLIIIFPAVFGGIEAILFAAPAADLIAVIVAVVLTATFMNSLKGSAKEEECENEPLNSPNDVIAFEKGN